MNNMRRNLKLALAGTILFGTSYAYAAESYFTPDTSLNTSTSNTASAASSTVGQVKPVSPVTPVAPVTLMGSNSNVMGEQNYVGPGGTEQPKLGPNGSQKSGPLGPGGSGPTMNEDFENMIQGLQVISGQVGNLDADIKNGTTLNNTIWNDYVGMQANDLFPQDTANYLENGSAFQSMSTLANMSFQNNLTTSNINFIANLQNCGAQIAVPGQSGATQCSQSNLQTYAASTLVDSLQYQNINPSGYIGALFNSSELKNPSAQENAANSAALSAAYSALQSIINTRSTMAPAATATIGGNAGTNNSTTGTLAASNAASSANPASINASAATLGISQMAMMQNVVNTTMQQNWLNQISTATNPQLLRSIAILLAYNNYIQYQRYQQEQTTQILLATQVVQLTKIANLLAAQNKQQQQY